MNIKKIKVDKDFLYDLYGNLQAMIRYADDGMISRDDPDFKEFFADVDKAYADLKELDRVLTEPDPDPEDGDNTQRCVLCGCELEGYGNNPYPLATEGRCCDSCDMQVVAARMKIFMESRKGE